MGSAITNVHKEIYKVSRHYLTDRVMAVRCAAAKVFYEKNDAITNIFHKHIFSIITINLFINSVCWKC